MIHGAVSIVTEMSPDSEDLYLLWQQATPLVPQSDSVESPWSLLSPHSEEDAVWVSQYVLRTCYVHFIHGKDPQAMVFSSSVKYGPAHELLKWGVSYCTDKYRYTIIEKGSTEKLCKYVGDWIWSTLATHWNVNSLSFYQPNQPYISA